MPPKKASSAKRPAQSKVEDVSSNKKPKVQEGQAAVECGTGAPEKSNNGPALAGTVMVFTGEMEAIPRPEAEEKAKAAGAKVTGSVSGNTTYLVLGSYLEDGRPVEQTSKYRKYLDLKEKGKKCPSLLTEQEFLALLPGAGGQSSDAGGSSSSSSAAKPPAEEEREIGPWTSNSNEPWVDLHAPRDLSELIGNASNIKKVSEWLRDWDDVVFKGRKKAPHFKPGGGMPDNVNARAALVSGAPGIGKTTAVRLIAQSQAKGYDILEYNASDARGQKVIQSMAAGIADNYTLNFGKTRRQEAICPQLTRRAVIIMDEVDGMSAGDHGGNAALIKMIKKTKNPIICICNDSGSPKIRNLAFSCYDIKWSRPSKTLISQKILKIAGRMGFAVEPNAAENLAESCGNDIRMAINQLQVIIQSSALKLQTSLTYTGTKAAIGEMRKDQHVMMSPFDACKSLLSGSEARRMSTNDRIEMFFVDFSLVPLLVQENFLKAVEKKTDPQLMEDCAKAAALFTLGDVVSKQIQEHQEWGLLPSTAILSAVYPAHVTNGFVPFPQFTQYLGKYSNQSKMQRLSRELHAHIRSSSTTTRKKLISSGYADRLYKNALHPLLQEDIEGAVSLMDAYGLQREHIAEHLTELQMHLGQEEDSFKLVDSKVKAAMTRELNSGNHAVKVVLPATKKKRGGSMLSEDPDAPKADEDDDSKRKANAEDAVDDATDEKDEKIDKGGLIKVRKGSAKSSSSASAKAKAKLAKLSAKLNNVDDPPQASRSRKGTTKAETKLPSDVAADAQASSKSAAANVAVKAKSKAPAANAKAEEKASVKAKSKAKAKSKGQR